ncbi:MAG: PIN domain-containing protein [Proteobacteria bacterium]|nr:PIN domain-containing protein [Pseudomonadota bacterium]
MPSFFDTNILIYAVDHTDPIKRRKAGELLEREAGAGNAIISTQVLQEFYSASTLKLKRPLNKLVAEEIVEELMALPVKQVDTTIIRAAIKRNQTDQVSFWDALIIETALRAGARILWSEDMQHDREIDGLKIQNPFK